jgi:hypothetical protein
MDLGTFYALMAGTCFTLVGLWWTVVERHPAWKTDRNRRTLAGGVYLSFLLPGLMATLAQVSPDTPALWRVSFGACAIVGLYSTGRLLRIDRGTVVGPFRRFRWIVAVLYAVILVLGTAPELARAAGFTPLVVGSVLLVLLIVIAHGLTWEFMMEPDEEST